MVLTQVGSRSIAVFEIIVFRSYMNTNAAFLMFYSVTFSFAVRFSTMWFIRMYLASCPVCCTSSSQLLSSYLFALLCCLLPYLRVLDHFLLLPEYLRAHPVSVEILHPACLLFSWAPRRYRQSLLLGFFYSARVARIQFSAFVVLSVSQGTQSG